MPFILTFDCGTQSVRALLFDNRGNLAAKEQVYYAPYISEQPGWAERDPDFYWEKLCEAAAKLRRANESLWSGIIAISITCMRDTAVSLDRDLRPLRPSILWLDQREAACEKDFPFLSRAAFWVVGMLDAARAQRKCSKSNWIRENQPEIWEKTHKYVLLSCYITYKLTGNLLDSIANQVGHIPLDYKKKKWMTKRALKYRVFNIEPEKLPDTVEPGSLLGKVTQAAAEASGIPQGLPVVATGSDKGCETIGTGCIDETKGSLSFGTTSTIQLTTSRYVEPQRFLPAYPSVLHGMYNPEVEIYRGYWMISWFKSEFAEAERAEAEAEGVSVEEILNRRLAMIPPGANGLMLQPYWGPGLKHPEARGSIIGFSQVHTRAHIYRAIIEGVNYGLRDGLETVCRRAGMEVQQLTVSGGGSESDVICQITADMFGKEVLRAQTFETSGLGSAMAAFYGMGEFGSIQEAAEAMVHYTSTFQPSAGGAAIYQELFEKVYRGIYPRLQPIYFKLRDLYGG